VRACVCVYVCVDMQFVFFSRGRYLTVTNSRVEISVLAGVVVLSLLNVTLRVMFLFSRPVLQPPKRVLFS